MNTGGEMASMCNCLLARVVFQFILIIDVLKKLLLLHLFRICWRDDMYFLVGWVVFFFKELLNFISQ